MTNFDLIQIAKKNETIEKADVWLGKKDKLKLHVKNDIYKTIPKARKKLLKIKINYEGPIEAPIKKDDKIGKLKLIYDDELINEYDLFASENISKVNIFSRLLKSLNYLIWGDV